MDIWTIEALPARLLHTTFGLDTTFSVGDPTTNPVPTAVLDAGGRLYLGTVDQGPLYGLTRRTETGAVDTAWATAGHVTLPFEATVLAYDKHTGDLYAAGVEKAAPPVGDDPNDPLPVDTTLVVARLQPDGTLDRGYGTDGIASYLPGAGNDDELITFSAMPARLIPLAHRGLYVGMSTDRSEEFYQGGRDVDALAVMKLRSDGRRDVRFGRRGIASLDVEDSSYYLDEVSGGGSGITPTLESLATNADGGLNAVGSLKGYDTSYGYDDDYTRPDYDTFDVRQYRVTAAGDSGLVPGGQWSLLAVTDSAAAHGRFDDGGSIATLPGEPIAVIAGDGTAAFTLVPGQKPAAAKLPPATQFVPSATAQPGRLLPDGRGGYYALGTFGPLHAATGAAVARLRADLSIDRHWGRGGYLALGDDFNDNRVVVPDASGRLLSFGYDHVERFDGYGLPPVPVPTPGAAPGSRSRNRRLIR